MASTARASRIRLTELSSFGYEALNIAQRHLHDDAISDGSARWVAVPSSTAQGVIDFDREGPESAGVLVHVEITSDSPVADLSWMAAKAYTYALYTGCIDLLKRRATWMGKRRVLGAGSRERCEAQVGPVRIAVSVEVIERERVEAKAS